MAERKTYIFAGGGTGGHLYPAIAIAQQIKEDRPDAHIGFVGTVRGLENRVIPELGFPLSRIAVRGMVRSLTLKNLLVPFVLIYSLLQCLVLLLKHKPNAVIGTGGYVSGPVLFVASLLRIPTLIQEQNSTPGATTRLLSRVVKRVHISFETSRRYFKNQDKLHLTGNPVRKFNLSRSRELACAAFGLQANRPVLLIFGGSQGAHAVNQIIVELMPRIMDDSFLQIIWSTGRHDIEMVQQAVHSYADRIWVSAFISDMESAYSAADIAIARAGALTIAELTLAGVPAILVPYPYAAGNHQETNARALADKGACSLVLQSELTADTLEKELMNLLDDDIKRAAMAKAAAQSAFPTATADIVKSIYAIERGVSQ